MNTPPTDGHWPQPWPDIDQTLTEVVGAIDAADLDSAYDGTLADLGRRLDLARRIKMAVTYLIDNLELSLLERMDEDAVAIDGVGVLMRSYTRRSAWADDAASDRFADDLRRAVVARVALDVATGELDPIKANVARATVEELMTAIPKVSGTTVAGGRRLGINMDEYRTFTTVYRLQMETM